MLTPAELDVLETLEKAATPGEWFVGLRLGYGGWPLYSLKDMAEYSEEEGKQNAAFIQALRNAAPALFAALRAAWARAEAAEREAESLKRLVVAALPEVKP